MDWKIFWSLFLSNKEIFFEFLEILDENIFRNAIMANLLILVRKFVTKYKKQPDSDTLILLLDRLPESEKEHKSKYTDFLADIVKLKPTVDIDVFKEELKRIVQNYEIEKFILQTANKVGNISFDDILSDMRGIMNKYRPRSMGVDITESVRVVKMIRHNPIDKVTSGIESLDKVFAGGYGINELAVAMAPPGKGKSYFLINMMYGAMLAQKNVLYITFELSEQAVLRRLYSRISYSSKKELLEEEQVLKAANKFFTLAKAKGRVLYLPSKSLTVEGLEAVVEQQQMYFDFTPDLLIVDYLDLLAPRHTDLRLETRHRLRGITDDLRSIALRRNIPIVTATQANRASLAKVKITEANVSEAFGKIEVSDIVIAICQTEEEKKMNRARLVLLKNRDNMSGSSIEVYVDFERMILMDLVWAEKQGLLELKKEENVG